MDVNRLAMQYRGDKAAKYDCERVNNAKFKGEQTAVERLLSTVPKGSSIIDIPVGTGRFVELYKRLGLSASGFDISPDMLTVAAEKSRSLGYAIPLEVGNIMSLDAQDGSCDVALSICFFNWVDIPKATIAISELARVARDYVIVSIRNYVPINELRLTTLSGLFHFFSRPAAVIRRMLSKNALVVHHKQDVLDMFKQNNLDIVEALRVEPRKYGTDYFVYLLEKRPAGAR